MALVRQIIRVPYAQGFPHDDVVDIYDVSKYWVLMDVFYDDTWEVKPRPFVMVNPGAGVSAPYTDTTPQVTAYTNAGMIVGVVYYYSPAATDPNYTPQPPWYPRWGFFTRDYWLFLQRRVMNLHSALVHIVDQLSSGQPYTVDLDNIFMVGKSQGGAASLMWSMLSQTNGFNWDKYGIHVKAIINNQGLVGTTTEGWYKADRTLRVLGRSISAGRHPMFNIYNDQDPSGDYDVAARLRYAVHTSRRDDTFFINFTDMGHDADSPFCASLISAIIAGIRPYRGIKDSEWVNVYSEYELENQVNRVIRRT